MRIPRWPLPAAALLALLPVSALAQHHYRCDARPPLTQPEVPLWEGVAGTVDFPISRGDPSTRAYFNQGVALIYGFNHLESVLSFRKAVESDDECAICYWGIAIALGPNINEPIRKDRWEMAIAAIDSADMFSASPLERQYIDAARRRYFNADGTPPVIPSDTGEFRRMRGKMDTAYAAAMGALWDATGRRDPHLGTLYAEALMDLHPWDLWNRDGTEKWPETSHLQALVDFILSDHPNHVGAAHLKIHVWEGSPHPDRARHEADILQGLMPGSAHLTHMPSHIDHRMGSYAAGVARNDSATAMDRRYLHRRGWMWRYPMYYAHDNDFLWVSATFAGDSAAALASADSLKQIVDDDLAHCYPNAEHFLTAPILVRVRFGMFSQALQVDSPGQAYAYARAMWHYARGWALLRTQGIPEAERERDIAKGFIERLRGKTIANNPADTLVLIAVHTLTGEIEAMRDISRAIAELQEAVRLQDGLGYDEPPPFFYPARHSLGAVLLKADVPEYSRQARRVYKEDLGNAAACGSTGVQAYDVNRNPQNAWAYVGLMNAAKQLQDENPHCWQLLAEQAWAPGTPLPPDSRY